MSTPQVTASTAAGDRSAEAAPTPHQPTPPVHVPAPPAKPQRWWVSWLVLAVLGGAGYYAYPWIKPFISPAEAAKAPPGPRITPVVTAVAKRQDVTLYLNGLGTVTGFQMVTIRSRVDGELTHVGFTEGQMVHEGDVIATIDPRTYELQLKEAEAQLEKDKAILKGASVDLERYTSLARMKSITPQELDAQKSLVAQTQASIEGDEGRIASIKLQLSYCKIVSPLTGRIGLRNIDVGNLVRANDPTGLAVITQVRPIAVMFNIPEDEISRVQKAHSPATPLKVEAFDRGFRHKLSGGKLIAIDNQVDSTTGTVRLKAEFTNEDGLLFPNQFVNVRLNVETLKDVVTVPSAGVQRGPDSAYAYVVTKDTKAKAPAPKTKEPDPKPKPADSKAAKPDAKDNLPDTIVKLRPLEAGVTEGDQTVIEGGLEPGDIVVVDGVDKLTDGARVSVRETPTSGGKRGKTAATTQGETRSPETDKAKDKPARGAK
jgi:multidrug efflux system membrane fusion protein